VKDPIRLGLNFGKRAMLTGGGMAVLIALHMLSSSILRAQPTNPPQFEVASIRPCEPNGGGRGGPAPGRFNPVCGTVESFIRKAYGSSVQVFDINSLDPIDNAPAWTKSERYTINAKAPEGTPPAVMLGAMLRGLLEDRFKLKLHRETRQVPVYDLTVAKGGIKLKPRDPGSCVPLPGQRVAKPCNGLSVGLGPTSSVEFFGASMPDFAKNLRSIVDRPVIDKTGVVGIFDFRLQYSPDPPGGAATAEFTGPSVFTAIEEQLGLKLERARGPHEFLVVDSVERPSAN
jgi:uncharacterized protein (TIGR03435 family)